ncbi:MAG TPA: hypothetical protein VNK91_15820 [Burkholderiaceae bacterium]|nr:hypothetical protein [Burkholderiaceae bacterium]
MASAAPDDAIATSVGVFFKSRGSTVARRFARFVLIGSLLGAATVTARDLIGRVMPDTAVAYWFSVLAMYAVAVAIGYRLQSRYAFARMPRDLRAANCARYVLVASIGAALTSVLAVALRYGVPWGSLQPALAGAASFAAAALTVAPLTFRLNERFVFARPEPDSARRRRLASDVVETSLVAAFAGLFAIGFTFLAGHDHNWDQLNYHVYAGLAALSDRFDQDFFAASIQSYLNPYSFVPLFALVKTGWPALFVAATLALLHAANLVLAHRLAAVLLPGRENRWLRIVGVVLAAMAPVFLVELGSSFNDVLVSLPAVAAVLLLLKAGSRNWGMVLTAGALMGVATALKLTNAPYVVACAVAAGWVPGSPWRARLVQIVLFAAGCALGFLLAGGYWSYLLWREFGNPFFPFFNAVFQSPDFAAVSLKHERFLPQSALELAARPFLMADPRADVYTETCAPDVRFAVAGVLSLLVLLGPVLRGSAARTSTPAAVLRPGIKLLVPFWIGFTAWVATSGNGRYLMPLAIVCGPLVAWLVAMVCVSARVRLYLVAGVLTVQSLGLLVAADRRWSEVPWPEKGWFSISLPEGFARRQALYLSLDPQPAAFFAALADPRAGFVNLVGQNAIAPDGPGGSRVKRLIDAYGDRVWVTFQINALDAGANPLLPESDRLQSLLAPFGLRPRLQACEYARLDGLASLRKRSDGERMQLTWDAPFRFFAFCPTERIAPPQEWRVQRDAARLRFAQLESRCPTLFAPATAEPVQIGNAWSKFYVNTDVRVELEDDTIRLRGYRLAARNIKWGAVLDCGSLAGGA